MTPDRFVDRAEIAFLLEVTERTITNWVREHRDFPNRVKGKERSFPVRKCLAWKRDRAVADAITSMAPPPDPAKETLLEAERIKAVAEAEMAQLKVMKFKADLVEASVVGAEVSRAFNRVAARLKATPGEFAPRILQPLSMPEAISVLRDLVDTALSALQMDFDADDPMEDEPEPEAGAA